MAKISGKIFLDQNGDGTLGASDTGLAGITISLLNSSNVVVGTTTTASDGSYSFSGMAPATYSVKVTAPSGNAFSPTGTSSTGMNWSLCARFDERHRLQRCQQQRPRRRRR
jgi:protocatechuate 3,4-dioxygenase beta subunit